MKAVVTLGKYFGPKHPRKGQETGFIAKVADGRKVHTCRSNYGYWRAKIEKITATGGVLSVRYYSLYKKAVLMGTRSDNLPNGLYRDDDGSIGLIICPKCQRENYALNVALGYCTWCGYDANKDYNIHKDKDDESKGHN